VYSTVDGLVKVRRYADGYEDYEERVLYQYEGGGAQKLCFFLEVSSDSSMWAGACIFNTKVVILIGRFDQPPNSTDTIAIDNITSVLGLKWRPNTHQLALI
jgi:hypothetical protein